MNKTVKAFSILMVFGVAACSSGGSSSPGISQEENIARNYARSISTYKATVQEQLSEAQSALAIAESALLAAQNAKTSAEADIELNKVRAASALITTAAEKARLSANNAKQYIAKASSVSSTAEAEATTTASLATQTEEIVKKIEELLLATQEAVQELIKKEQAVQAAAAEEAAAKEALAAIDTKVKKELATAKEQLALAEAALRKTQAAKTSAEAAEAATQAKVAANMAKTAAEKAVEEAKNSGLADILSNVEAAQAMAKSAQVAADNASNFVAELLAKEEGIAREESEKIAKANSEAQAAQEEAQAQLEEAKAAIATVTLSSTTAIKATSSATANDSVTRATEALLKLEVAANAAKVAADKAKNVSSASEKAAEAAKVAQIAADEIANLVTNGKNAVKEATLAVNVLISREKEMTTSYSYSRSDSIVKDYLDTTKRDALLTEIKKNPNNLVAGGTSCKAGTASDPGPCFAGGTISKTGEIVQGKERGTLLGSYAQSYSGYAVLREEYSNLSGATNTGDANAYLALAQSDQLVSDKALVTNATYTGTASYSTRGIGVIATDLLTMNVKDDNISGYVYRTVTSGRGNTTTRAYVQMRDAQIKVDNGVVGFDGNAFIDSSAKGVNGNVPTSTADAANGTYRGVFVGPNAKEVVGTFETNTDVVDSVRGAFAGSKE